VTDDSTDSKILAQEQFTIELLSRETHTAVAKVQEIFLIEYGKLAPHAHVTAFLSLLASNRVRAVLAQQHASHDSAQYI
jgi:hypothetical protein